jgi:hypothetical protein
MRRTLTGLAAAALLGVLWIGAHALGQSTIGAGAKAGLQAVLQGTGFLASRAAVINSSGRLDGASGTLTDCLKVNGSSGPCGGALGFTAENVANKSTDTALGSSDTLYPTQKAVQTYVDAHASSGGGLGGLVTVSGAVASLAVGRYGFQVNGSPVTFALGPASITKIAGTNNGTFLVYIDYNAGSPVARCVHSGGISMGNYTVSSGFSGSTCPAGTSFPACSIPLASIDVSLGVFQTPADVRPQMAAMGACWVAGDNVSMSGNVLSSIGFNPISPTTFFRQVSFLSAFEHFDGYTYANGCTTGNAEASGPGVDSISLLPYWFLKTTGNGTVCLISWPAGSGIWHPAFPDLFSGGTPALHSALAHMGKHAVNSGIFFVGWSHSYTNIDDFFGCRAVGTANWFAVVRTAGVDTGTPADTGAANDLNSHRIGPSNGTSVAAANSITCTVDTHTATIAATVPAGPDWYLVAGAQQSGGTASVFRASMYEIYVRGLP